MRLKYKCKNCDNTFNKENSLHAHILFEHQFLMPICSTGLAEKIFIDNMELIKNFKRFKQKLSISKTQLKKRYLKSVYMKIDKQFGKDYMKNVKLNNEFNLNLASYHDNTFTRIQYVDHFKYDEYYNETVKLLKEIETKGLILG